MINQKIKLVRPGLFLPFFSAEKEQKNKIIVRPTVLSICAADQRYFRGSRPAEILKAKLPMCLIHEGIGQVIFDPHSKYKAGQNVILLPNGGGDDQFQNYSSNSYFRSSSADGFTQEFIGLEGKELISFDSRHSNYYVFAELLSVCFQAITRIPNAVWTRSNSIGIWGDGVVGYLLSLCIKREYPNLNVTIFGKHEEKLLLFSHADDLKIIGTTTPSGPEFDIAFEAVGGAKAGDAINQIIELVKPCSYVCLTGVSEFPVPINTRKILEKGLSIIGTTRSLRRDFLKARGFLEKTADFSIFDKIISDYLPVGSSEDLTQAFYSDQKTPYKTLIDWNI